jgi:hypothetical protein
MPAAQCEICGNHYDKAFEVVSSRGTRHIFDSFECAIQALAPTCAHCKCRVLGHGTEQEGVVYCCAHCAKEAGLLGMKDRVYAGESSARAPTSSPAGR